MAIKRQRYSKAEEEFLKESGDVSSSDLALLFLEKFGYQRTPDGLDNKRKKIGASGGNQADESVSETFDNVNVNVRNTRQSRKEAVKGLASVADRSDSDLSSPKPAAMSGSPPEITWLMESGQSTRATEESIDLQVSSGVVPSECMEMSAVNAGGLVSGCPSANGLGIHDPTKLASSAEGIAAVAYPLHQPSRISSELFPHAETYPFDNCSWNNCLPEGLNTSGCDTASSQDSFIHTSGLVPDIPHPADSGIILNAYTFYVAVPWSNKLPQATNQPGYVQDMDAHQAGTLRSAVSHLNEMLSGRNGGNTNSQYLTQAGDISYPMTCTDLVTSPHSSWKYLADSGNPFANVTGAENCFGDPQWHTFPRTQNHSNDINPARRICMY